MKTNLKVCDGCGEPRKIWKNVSGPDGRERYCQICWSRQGTKKSKPTAKKPPRSRSPKRKKEEQIYSSKRKKFLEEKPHCEIAIPGICTHKSTDVHHRDGRTNEKLNDEEEFLSGCRQCHVWVHAHPEEARQLGFLI